MTRGARMPGVAGRHSATDVRLMREQAQAERTFSKAVKGVGLPETPTAFINKKAQEEAHSLDALFGSLTANAGPTRDRFRVYPETGLTPKGIADIQKQASIGMTWRWQELLEAMIQRDARMMNTKRGREVAVSGRPYSLRPCDDSPEAGAMAALCWECLDGLSGFRRALRHLLGAPYAGYASDEPIYRYRRVSFPWENTRVTFDALAAEELRPVHGKHFQFTTDNTSDEPLPEFGKVVQVDGQTPLLNVGAGSIYLPKSKFIFHTSGESGQIQRRGWGWPAVWLHALKQKMIAMWGEFGSRFGVPNVRGTVPYNIWTDKVRSLKYYKIVQAFGDGVHALTPDDLKIMIDQFQPGGSSRDTFGSLIGFLDTTLTILGQGEHLTTEIGDSGSYNAADAQAAEKRAVVEDDAQGAGETLREWFRVLIWLNRADLVLLLQRPIWLLLRKAPVVVFRLDAHTSRKERLEEMAIARNKLQLAVTERQVQDEGGFDPPMPGERVVRGEPVQVYPGSKMVSSAAAAAGAENPQDGPG